MLRRARRSVNARPATASSRLPVRNRRLPPNTPPKPASLAAANLTPKLHKPALNRGNDAALQQDLSAAKVPVVVADDPQGVLQPSDAGPSTLLSTPYLLVERELEALNIFLGYEQANRYVIKTTDDQVVGYLIEEDSGFGKAISRQFLRTHRAFSCIVMDKEGKVIMRVCFDVSTLVALSAYST